MITVLIFFGFVACQLEMHRGAWWPTLAYAAIGALGGQDALAMYSAGLIAVGLAEIGLRTEGISGSDRAPSNYS